MNSKTNDRQRQTETDIVWFDEAKLSTQLNGIDHTSTNVLAEYNVYFFLFKYSLIRFSHPTCITIESYVVLVLYNTKALPNKT